MSKSNVWTQVQELLVANKAKPALVEALEAILAPKQAGGSINPPMMIDDVMHYYCRFHQVYEPETNMVMSAGKSKGYCKASISVWNKRNTTIKKLEAEISELVVLGDFEQAKMCSDELVEAKKLVIKPDLYDQNLKVHSSFDLGMNDTFSIGFFQIHPNGKPKIIGEYENSGHGLQHYKDIFEALSKKYGWVHGQTYVPHDTKVRELIADKTRWQAMKEMGFKPVLVTRHRIQDGIEATRQFLKTVEIDDKCETVVNAIQSYRKKYDKTFSVYLDSPVHDEHSHTADMLRYMAMGLKHRPITDIFVRDIPYQSSTKFLNKSYDV